MKRVLTLGLALSMAASQAFSYTVQTIKEVEATSASAKAAEVIVQAVLPAGPANASLQQIGALTGEINRLASYALQDQSCSMRIIRVIDNLNKKAAWQTAHAIDGAFAKNYAFELSHGITAEVVRFFAHKAIAAGMTNVTDERLTNRAAHAVGEAVSSALIETAFAKLGDYVVAKEGEKTECSKVLLQSFFTTLVREAAYNLAGEMIWSGASDTAENYAQAVHEALGLK